MVVVRQPHIYPIYVCRCFELILWTVTPPLQGGGTGEEHMDIFQMMREVVNGGGPKSTKNGLGPVEEEEEHTATSQERRKKPPAATVEVRPRQRLKSDSHMPSQRPACHGGGSTVQHQPKKMSRSVQSTSGLPRTGQRTSSESSSSYPKMKESVSFTSLKEKK